MKPEQALEEKSKRFHAFEWLRAEALKGNRHAAVLIREIIRLKKLEGPPNAKSLQG